MSIRDEYKSKPRIRVKTKTHIKFKTGETKMVIVVRDKDGNPKFADDFPEDFKQQILEKVNGN